MTFIVELKGEKIIENVQYKFIDDFYENYSIFPIKNSFLEKYWKNLKEFGWIEDVNYIKEIYCSFDFPENDNQLCNFEMDKSNIPCLIFEFVTEEEAFYFKMKYC